MVAHYFPPGGGGGSGTVNSGTTGQLAFYQTGGTAVSSLIPASSGIGLTIYAPTPVHYVSLRANGVATTDPTNPATTGSDVSAKLQAIADDTTAYNTIFCDGGCYKGQVSLPSGRGIQGTGGRWDGTAGAAPKTGLIIPQTSGWAVTNKNWRTPVVSTNGLNSGTTIETTPFSQIVDQDIIIRDLWIHANQGYTAGTSGYDPTGAVSTVLQTPVGAGASATTAGDLRRFAITLGGVTLIPYITPILFNGCRNLTIQDVSTYQPVMYGVNTSYVDGLFIDNLFGWAWKSPSMTFADYIDHFGNYNIGQPMQLDGMHSNMRVHNVSGACAGDAIALNATDGGLHNTTTTGNFQSYYAAAFKYYQYEGPISRVIVDGITMRATADFVRFLGGSDSVQVENVTISNCTGVTFGAIFIMEQFTTNTGSPIGDVVITNCNIKSNADLAYLIPNNANPSVAWSLNTRSLTLSNCTFTDIAANMGSLGLFNVFGTAAIYNFLMSNCVINGWQNIFNMTAGTIALYAINGCMHFNKGAGAFSINTTGGAPTTLVGRGNAGISQGGSMPWQNNYFQGNLDYLYPIADPASVFVGQEWNSAAAGGHVLCRALDGSNNPFIKMDDGTFFKCGACTQLANFTTAASLFGSPANSWGSLLIPGGALKVGQRIELSFTGTFGVTSGTSQFTFTPKLGATSLGAVGPLQPSATALANQLFQTDWTEAISFVVLAIGSSGSITISGGVGLWTGTAALTTGYFSPGGYAAGGSGTPITVDTTAPLLIDLQVSCNTANAANNIQILGGSARIKG